MSARCRTSPRRANTDSDSDKEVPAAEKGDDVCGTFRVILLMQERDGDVVSGTLVCLEAW